MAQSSAIVYLPRHLQPSSSGDKLYVVAKPIMNRFGQLVELRGTSGASDAMPRRRQPCRSRPLPQSTIPTATFAALLHFILQQSAVSAASDASSIWATLLVPKSLPKTATNRSKNDGAPIAGRSRMMGPMERNLSRLNGARDAGDLLIARQNAKRRIGNITSS